MRFFKGLLLGIILGAAGYWFLQTKPAQHPEAEQHYRTSAEQPASSTGDTNGRLSEAFNARREALDLRTDQIKDELARTGKVIRRKAQDFGAAVADATADTRIEAGIKANYAVDPNLSVWRISVSSTQGHVTLSGTVSTADDIGRAMALALEVDGVRDVISTIQVKPAT
ncbi:MAG: BON domain-containing protein [Verrucomicrobiota bacterium]|jgi:hypothetical protein